jgi:hypothetical protein
MKLNVHWNRNAYAIVDVDVEDPDGRPIVRDNMWDHGWARADEDFGGNVDAYVLDLHKNQIIRYIQSGLTSESNESPTGSRTSTVPAREFTSGDTEKYFTINVHLGKGRDGARRLYALKSLAVEAGYLWNGEPSIGRWLSAIADEKLDLGCKPGQSSALDARLKTLAREQIRIWQALIAERG